MINADGSGFKEFLHTKFTYGKWSPSEDDKIVYAADIQNNYEIFSMTIWESERKQLTKNTIDDTYPVWSANGSTIFFTRGTFNDSEIWQMDPHQF